METNNKIKNSYSLLAFAQTFGSDIRVGTCQASDGTTFPACTFSGGSKGRILVHFGPSLPGGLSFEEICAQAGSLQVVELNVDAEVIKRRVEKKQQLESYILCKEGESSWKGGNLFAALGN